MRLNLNETTRVRNKKSPKSPEAGIKTRSQTSTDSKRKTRSETSADSKGQSTDLKVQTRSKRGAQKGVKLSAIMEVEKDKKKERENKRRKK